MFSFFCSNVIIKLRVHGENFENFLIDLQEQISFVIVIDLLEACQFQFFFRTDIRQLKLGAFRMDLIRKVRCSTQQKYDSVKNKDVHDAWVWVLIHVLVMNHRPGDQKKRLYVLNIMICVWLLLNAVRFGSAFVVSEEKAHLYGHTLGLVGSPVIYASGLILLVQCCLYRLALIRLIMKDGVIIVKTLHNIVNERDVRMRGSKIRMARVVLFGATAVWFTIIVCGGFFLGSRNEDPIQFVNGVM